MPRELNNELHELIGSNEFNQEVVYLLACAVMQQFYGQDWMDYSEDLE